MRVLIACEESQTVCKAFRERGHEAYSCDILPCSGGFPEWHIQCDVLKLWPTDWDLIISFPPCDHLAVSGARWFTQKIKDGRQQAAINFFLKMAKISHAVENPIGIMSTHYRKPDQIIQPWQFGDSYQKTTCLWLNGLNKLEPTKIVSPGEFVIHGGKKLPKWYSNRTRDRSKTFTGIANGMADQWGNFISNKLTA